MKKTSKLLLGIAATGALTALLCTGCLTVPLQPDRPDLANFTPPAPAKATVEVTPIQTGHRLVPRCATAGEASCFSPAHIVHATYLVKHGDTRFLIDSGVSEHGRDDLSRFGFVDRSALEYTEDTPLKEQLAALGNPKIAFVILTHSHWDHSSGLRDLDHPRVEVGPGEAEFIKNFPKDQPPSVMPDHLAQATVETIKFDGPPYENFPTSHDWFGDGSVVVVPLPGHTPGSVGVFLNEVHGRRLFFIGDAAWNLAGVDLPSQKAKPMSKLVDHDPAMVSETLWRLHHLHEREPNLLIVPAHDGDALEQVKALGH
jgi:glyoxylase-like metal-dependent hydrolase (beta-lactamase superfamily II)